MNYSDNGEEGPDLNLLFQHGWAFSCQCCRGWEPLLPPAAKVVYGCRGYWQAEARAAGFTGEGRKAIVAHSLGVHLLEPALLAQVELLVVIGGFRYFHGEEERDGVLSRRHLLRLRQRLAEDPERLAADFYRDCEAPFPVPPGARINRARLAADLELLDHGMLDLSLLAPIPRILLLHGRQDRIVPPLRAEQLQARLPNANLVLLEGGHGLPFTAPASCWARIGAELA